MSKKLGLRKTVLTKNPVIQCRVSFFAKTVLIAFLGVSQRGEPKSTTAIFRKNLFLAVFELPVPRNICLARW
jgi:hypothetical protein